MADLKLSETATIAAKHKQKSELKVQGDCHSRDKIYCCNSPWLWWPKEKKKNHNKTKTPKTQQIYRHISVYLYMKGGKQIIYKEEGI